MKAGDGTGGVGGGAEAEAEVEVEAGVGTEVVDGSFPLLTPRTYRGHHEGVSRTDSAVQSLDLRLKNLYINNHKSRVSGLEDQTSPTPSLSLRLKQSR